MLNFDPGGKEMALRHRALAEGVDYEDFLLHFSEDTEIDPPKPEHGSATSLAGRPWVVGWTAAAGLRGRPPFQSLWRPRLARP